VGLGHQVAAVQRSGYPGVEVLDQGEGVVSPVALGLDREVTSSFEVGNPDL